MRRRRQPIPTPADCFFCKKSLTPQFKEVKTLEPFISDRGKVLGRVRTGLCQKHQKKLAKEVKRARHLALLPFTERS